MEAENEFPELEEKKTIFCLEEGTECQDRHVVYVIIGGWDVLCVRSLFVVV